MDMHFTPAARHCNRTRTWNESAQGPLRDITCGGVREDRAMVMIVATVAVVPGREEEWEAVWRHLRTTATGYPGFRRMTLLRDTARPGHYVVSCEWESRSEFDEFRRSSGVEWLNRGQELWMAAPPLVYDEIVDSVESEMSNEG
jgi:heme-degrading monooxygenase HmoA